jgi:Ca2+-binding RTX toxin-like protein
MAIINGTAGGDTLTGTNQADRISGLGGDDWLSGLGGDDELDGGAGADLLDGAEGFDTASYRGSASGVIVRLNGGFGKGGDAEGDGLFGIEGAIGSAHDDFLVGTDGRSVLRGENGNDVLYGLGGDDELEGGAGADTLDGFDGFDTASYANSNAAVRIDLINPNIGGGHAAGDILLNIEGVVGSAYGDFLFGNAARNVFSGQGGNDTLVGNDGDDELRGGGGIDTARFYFADAVVADLASGTATGDGNDRLFGIENLVGGGLGDELSGNGGANVLTGGFGGDFLTGRGGADRFDYNFRDDSLRNAPDLIQDFSRTQGDRIDLAGIDARANVVGNQTFNFIGQAQFTAEGQVRSYQQGGDTFIEVNTNNGLPGADMVIVLDTGVAMQGADFIL